MKEEKKNVFFLMILNKNILNARKHDDDEEEFEMCVCTSITWK